MAYKDKYYYIDNDGNKKKYIGKVTYSDGIATGILSKIDKSVVTKELIYHPEIEEVKGYYSYYSYVNNLNEEVRQFDNIRRDENNVPFFTYTEKDIFKLDYNPAIEGQEEYYTYIDPVTKQEKVYTGSMIKHGSKIYGLIQK